MRYIILTALEEHLAYKSSGLGENLKIRLYFILRQWFHCCEWLELPVHGCHVHFQVWG
jgi:hypothetical protein